MTERMIEASEVTATTPLLADLLHRPGHCRRRLVPLGESAHVALPGRWARYRASVPNTVRSCQG